MTEHILTRAKAYAALLGLVITFLLGQVPAGSSLHAALLIFGGLATVLATYHVPNKTSR